MKVAALSLGTIVLIQLSCYVEEWIFKQLPGFHFHWTVAFVELLLFAAMGRAAQGRHPPARVASLQLYCGVGGSLALGTGLGKVAFRYLNYATGTVLKSMKLLPVIAISTCWLRRSYSVEEYVAAFLMVVSAALFGLGERALEPSFHPLGIVLSFGCLLAQAVQSNLQDKVLRDHAAPVHEAMLYANAFGAVFVFGITLANGELVESVPYFVGSSLAASLLLLRSITFYGGGLLYTMLLQQAGAVTAVAVTTVRKSLTVVLSFIFFPKPWSSNYGWGGIALAVAIALDMHAHHRRGGPPPAAGQARGGKAGGSLAPAKDSDEDAKDSDMDMDEGSYLVPPLGSRR